VSDNRPDDQGSIEEAMIGDLDHVNFDVDDRLAACPRALTRKPHLYRGAHLNWLAVTEAQARRLAPMVA
jgi:hypothetical protein